MVFVATNIYYFSYFSYESEKKSNFFFFLKNLLGNYSRPQQAALGLFWATIVAHSSVRVNDVCSVGYHHQEWVCS